jgi:hypothetical protein
MNKNCQMGLYQINTFAHQSKQLVEWRDNSHNGRKSLQVRINIQNIQRAKNNNKHQKNKQSVNKWVNELNSSQKKKNKLPINTQRNVQHTCGWNSNQYNTKNIPHPSQNGYHQTTTDASEDVGEKGLLCISVGM